MPHAPAYRLLVPGLVLALTGLAALPAAGTPVPRATAQGTAPLVLPDPQPVRADARHAPRPAPRPVADPPGFESLWFVGVFQ